jgi:hypothetical protein
MEGLPTFNGYVPEVVCEVGQGLGSKIMVSLLRTTRDKSAGLIDVLEAVKFLRIALADGVDMLRLMRIDLQISVDSVVEVSRRLLMTTMMRSVCCLCLEVIRMIS